MPLPAFTPEGEPIDVPDEVAADAFRQKKIFFQKGARIPVSQGTHFGTVPVESLSDALAKGWKINQAGVQEARDQARYGAPGQEAAAALEGVAAGATAGISRPLETALGLTTKEEMAGRQRASPYLSGGAELLGAIGPALIGEEGGLIAEGGRLLPAAGIARVGETVAGGKGVLAGLTRGAVETGLFGATDEASRQILEGDQASIPVRAQKILATAGTSALFGAGVSGVFHVAGALSSGILGKAKGLVQAFAPTELGPALSPGSLDAAVDAIQTKAVDDPTTFGGKVMDALIGKDKRASVGRLMDRGWRELATTAESDANRQVVDAADSISQMVKTIDDAQRDIRLTIKPEEVSRGLATVDPVTVRQSLYDLATRMYAKAEEMERAPADFFGSGKIDQLKAQARKIDQTIFTQQVGKPIIDSAGIPMLDESGAPILETARVMHDRKLPTAQEMWDALNKAKQNLATIEKLGDSIPATERPAAVAVGDFRKEAQRLLTDQAIFGQAAAIQAKWNGLLEEWIGAAERFLETKAFGEREGFRGGKPLFDVQAGSLETFLRSLGEPKNQSRLERFVEFLQASKSFGDEFGADAHLQGRLQAAYTKTAEVAKLAKAQADLTRVKGTTGGVLNVVASPIGRMVMGGFVGGPLGAIAAAAAPKVGSLILHLLDQIASRNSAEIRGLARSIAKGTLPLGERAPVAALKVLELARFSDRAAKPTRDSRASYSRVAGEIRALAADPGKTQQQMSARVAPITAEAPRHAAAIVAQGMRNITFLASKLPPPAQRGPLQAVGHPTQDAPSESEIASFAEALKVVENPTIALDDLARGRLSIDAAHALQSVYPELFAEMKDEILHAVQVANRPIPYETRLRIGLFFGEPLDPSLSPAFIQAAQSVYAPAPVSPLTGPTLKSNKDLKSIKNAATAAQQLELQGSKDVAQ